MSRRQRKRREIAALALKPEAVGAIGTHLRGIFITLVRLLDVPQVQEEAGIFLPGAASCQQAADFILIVLRLNPGNLLLVGDLHFVHKRGNHPQLALLGPSHQRIRFGFVFHITQQFINELLRVPGLP